MPRQYSPRRNLNESGGSTLVADLVKLIRVHQPTYDALNSAVHRARQLTELRPVKRQANRLPKVLTQDEMDRVRQAAMNLPARDLILFELTYYTGLRVSEVASLELDWIDWSTRSIGVTGKGDKDRRVVFDADFAQSLRVYTQSLPKSEIYVFPTAFRSPITSRRIQQVFRELGRSVGIRLHPHMLRHTLITDLTRAGMSTSKIMLISGHANPATLNVYQHLALPDVTEQYDEAMWKTKGRNRKQ